MSVSAEFYKFSKRKNSTKQPTGTGTVYNVDLKSGTSFLSPILLLNNSGKPDFNYCIFGGWYYFVRDIVSVRNDLWEVYCTIDALATAKSAITGSTQFVSYSSQLGSSWLPDTRIPVLKSTTVQNTYASLSGLFNTNGFYVLSFVGKSGCETVCLNKSVLSVLIDEISNWEDDGITGIVNDSMNLMYDWTTVEDSLASLGKMMIQTGFIGNAFANAPSCIRSCIWVPFLLSAFSGASKPIWLGDYDTTHAGFELNASPTTGSESVNIPWTYSDWRRAVCEDVYLYLPLVGMVNLSSDSLTHASSITVEYSATGTDGVIAYRVLAGGEIIGTYGGQCSANYPIGINQQASAGQIFQSILQGGEKMVNAAVHSTISPVSMAAAPVAMAYEGAVATYDSISLQNTRNLTCIGGIGGGAGVGLSLNIECYVVTHDLNISPSQMATTMGVPTMKPMSLSSLTGYCQCANAHVEADLPAPVLDTVDTFLNSGFFIE